MKTILLYILLLSSLVMSAQHKIKVACVGNSVTYGYLLPDREKEAYPFQLQKLLGSKYEVGNFGKSGATLLSKGHRPYIEQEEYKKALEFAGDIVIIHLGLNDTDPRNWPNYKDEFLKNYLDLISSFRNQNPKAEVWICRLSPITHKHPRFVSGTRDWYNEIQQTIEEIATYANVGLIDFQESLYNRPDLLPDALHPSAEGAGILAHTAYRAITGDYGGLQMSSIYSDNMVLQRNIPLKINGIANVGEEVTVTIDKQKAKAIAKSNGKWEVVLNPLEVGDARSLKISTSKNLLTYKNVLVGEVWLCSGQSNMAFKLLDDADFDKNKVINNPNVRFFDMRARWDTNPVQWNTSVLDSLNRLEYYKGATWTECNNISAAEFSAVAYYFGQMLSDSLNVPIGLIHNAIGGSPLESWIDRRTLEHDFPEILRDWKKNDFIQDWVRGRATFNIGKSDNPEQRHPYEPCYLFESGVMTLSHFPIKGVIWYQGESNAHNMEAHEKLFPLFVNSWRNYWSNPKLPFYYVQLSSLNRPSWTWFRDSQRKMMTNLSHIYMAVSSDRGDSLDVHPRHKKDIGQRLAFGALNKEYNKKDITPFGPLYKSVEYKNGKACVSFDYADGLQTSNGEAVFGFEIAEVDGLFFPAKAEIDGNRMMLWSAEVNNPKYVRYGWEPFTRANVVNSANLPMSTFRTEKIEDRMIQNQSTSLSDFPISGGVSAPFTAVYNNKLYVIGGCNFPNEPASEGGKKEFYSEIYSLDISGDANSNWVRVGDLPYKVAYGVTAVVDEGILCIGGQNSKSSLKDVSLIKIDPKTKKLSIKKLSSLPAPLFNAGIASIGDDIYVAGGNGNTYLYSLNIKSIENKWQTIDANQKQERQQPVVFSQNGDLYMAGGYDESQAKVFTDVVKFDFEEKEWKSYDEIKIQNGVSSTFVGSASVNHNSNTTLFVGGVDYELFASVLERNKKLKQASLDKQTDLVLYLQDLGKQYMNQAIEWYRFSPKLVSYDARNKVWSTLGEYPILSRAGAGVVYNNDKLYQVCGELKPGIRTEEVNSIKLN